MQGNISFTGDLSGSITGEGGGGVPHITATASVDPNTGIPEVSVSRSGTDENPNFAFAFKNLKGSQGIQGLPGQNGQNGVDGVDGEDGVSPVIFVTDITGGHRVKIIDVDHPLGQTFDVMNGINGQNGADGSDGSDGSDGYSPVVTITDITGGHRVNITDQEHPTGQNFDVMNGQNGQQGEQGQQGEPGVGVPAGGSIGQVLTKITTMDYQTGWSDLSGDDVAYDSNDSVNDKITEISSNLAQKQDALTVSTMSVTSDQTPNPFASGVTGYINLVKYGRVVGVTGVIKVTSANTNLDICTLPNGYRPHATNVWLSSDFYGDTNGCEFRIITDGKVNCAIPSGSVNKDIKVSGSFISNV